MEELLLHRRLRLSFVELLAWENEKKQSELLVIPIT